MKVIKNKISFMSDLKRRIINKDQLKMELILTMVGMARMRDPKSIVTKKITLQRRLQLSFQRITIRRFARKKSNPPAILLASIYWIKRAQVTHIMIIVNHIFKILQLTMWRSRKRNKYLSIRQWLKVFLRIQGIQVVSRRFLRIKGI